jgi:hypothetical protein
MREREGWRWEEREKTCVSKRDRQRRREREREREREIDRERSRHPIIVGPQAPHWHPPSDPTIRAATTRPSARAALRWALRVQRAERAGREPPTSVEGRGIGRVEEQQDSNCEPEDDDGGMNASRRCSATMTTHGYYLECSAAAKYPFMSRIFSLSPSAPSLGSDDDGDDGATSRGG